MSLADRLESTYSGAVYDVLRSKGYNNQTLPQDVRPLDPGKKLAGPAFTVSGHYEEGLDPHETLMQWTAVLSEAPAGTVVVCQPNDNNLAYMGELSAETLHLRGIRGYIVEGGCRDTELILKLGFKVWCRYTTPMDVVGRWIPDELGHSVTIGAVSIDTGDYVMADRDGVVVIPAEIAGDVIDETESVLATESQVRRGILEGMDPQAAYLRYGKF